MKENKSTFISTGNRNFVTIKIDTNMLVEMFNDINEPCYKVKNKLGFACAISKAIGELLIIEGLNTVMKTIADNNETWIKYCNNDEE